MKKFGIFIAVAVLFIISTGAFASVVSFPNLTVSLEIPEGWVHETEDYTTVFAPKDNSSILTISRAPMGIESLETLAKDVASVHGIHNLDFDGKTYSYSFSADGKNKTFVTITNDETDFVVISTTNKTAEMAMILSSMKSIK